MTTLDSLYPAHIATLQARTKEALAREGLDGLVIHSGQSKRLFLDDNHYPFKVNPHFKAWLPLVEHPHCWLIVNGVDKPKLIYFQPVDFWHKVEPLPDAAWTSAFTVEVLQQPEAVERLLPYDKKGYAYVGEYIEVAQALGFNTVNPDRVLHYLHYHRAIKTPYELACMRQASGRAVAGHVAAKAAFMAGGSEFDIHLAYLAASQQTDYSLPYNSIVALNEHAAILHYMHYDTQAPVQHRSFLIDAGGSFHGYAADISRTYARDPASRFAELINAIDRITLSLVNALKPGIPYADIHTLAHEGIAQVLQEHALVSMDAQAMVDCGITRTFFPHGVGHFLGLQVHDVGGLVHDDWGTPHPAPAQHPFLRCTRTVAPGQVFTIEPGLYFIPSLLAELKASDLGKQVNWALIETLLPYGGIRIEDNIIVHAQHNENMTREGFNLG